jgi:ABC-type glycerol-3-phosphate transport system substrate-binding protein
VSGRGFLALVCLGALAAGCGGTSQSEKVKATVVTYFEAFAAGEGQRACDQLTGDQVRAVLDIAIEQVPELGARSCAQTITRLAQQLGADEKATLRSVDVFDVAIHGNTATAFVQHAAPIELRRTAGRWLISAGIGQG